MLGPVGEGGLAGWVVGAGFWGVKGRMGKEGMEGGDGKGEWGMGKGRRGRTKDRAIMVLRPAAIFEVVEGGRR